MKCGFRLFGKYTLEAHNPIRVKDQDEAIALFCENRWEIPYRLLKGVIPHKFWENLRKDLDLNFLKQLDSLVDGGGELIWRDVNYNRVVNYGLNDILDKYFKGSTYTAAHYVGLTDGTPTTAAADGIGAGEHSGWVEVTAYDEATRQTYTPGTVASQTVNNSASKATFTISANSTTIGGAFLVTNSTRGGITGTLISVEAATAGDVTLNDGDSLSVQIDYTAADS